MTVVEKLEHAVIVGASGGFGRQFARRLSESGVRVTGVDRVPGSDVFCDITVDVSPLRRLLSDADALLLCVPEEIALAALAGLDAIVPPGVLLVDICSVKSNICAAAQRQCLDAEYVSLHPMFGPEREFVDSNAVWIPLRGGPRASAFKELLQSWQLALLECDADTHDRVTGLVQVFTHAVLCTFANARGQFDVDDALVSAFATPVFAELERVSMGLIAENPLLYHNIQTANPWGNEARDKLRHALDETLTILAGDDPQAMVELFERVRERYPEG